MGEKWELHGIYYGLTWDLLGRNNGIKAKQKLKETSIKSRFFIAFFVIPEVRCHKGQTSLICILLQISFLEKKEGNKFVSSIQQYSAIRATDVNSTYSYSDAYSRVVRYQSLP